MKKLIIAAIATITLSACATPDIENNCTHQRLEAEMVAGMALEGKPISEAINRKRVFLPDDKSITTPFVKQIYSMVDKPIKARPVYCQYCETAVTIGYYGDVGAHVKASQRIGQVFYDACTKRQQTISN